MPGLGVEVASDGKFTEFYCGVCKLLLKDPIQLVDGSRICLSCYDENQRKRTEQLSNVFGDMNGESTSLTSTSVREKGYFRDKFAEQRVSEIKVYCTLKSYGCEWVGPVKDLEKHVEMCDKKPATCPHCGLNVPPNRMHLHITEGCRERSVNCKFYSEDMETSSLESLANGCKGQSETCDKCSMALDPEQMVDHKKIWCKKSTGLCPFTDEGCDHEEVMDKKGVLQHIKDNLIYHILVLLGHLKIITRALSDVQGKLSVIKDDIYNQIQRLSDMVHNTQSKIVSWTEYLREQLQNQSNAIEDTRSRTAECENALQTIIAEKNNYQAELTDIQSRATAHGSQIEEQLTAINDMQKRFNAIADKIEALRTAVYDIRKSQQKILGQGPTATLQIPVFPTPDSPEYIVTYNGELTWKISDVMHKRREAIMNRTRSFYSPPFFTSPSGYMCCGRLYINGDGAAKGTHISVFFVVMKGPFDALQQWPFNKRITLMLLNQDGDCHHEESFKPDLSSSSFERPKKETNIASGSPFFYSLNALESNGFLREDTMYIRIKVAV